MEKCDYGKRIRQALLLRGVTQIDVSKRIGITPNTLNMIIKGKTKAPRAQVLTDIARLLNVRGDYLLCLSDEIEG